MVNFLQHSAGVTLPGRKKMQFVLLWFIFSGTLTGTFSASKSSKSQERSQTISDILNTRVSEDLPENKRNSENSTFSLNSKPVSGLHRAPVRVSRLKKADKKHDTVIPMVRFGRTREDRNYGSVIPYPRFGRSDSQNSNQLNNYENKNTDDRMDDVEDYISVDENGYVQEVEKYEQFENDDPAQKRSSDDNKASNPNSENELVETQNSIISEKNAEDESDHYYMLPQIRYDRSMLLFTAPKTEETPNQKTPPTFVLPYPRPGRSKTYRLKAGNLKNEHLILPYPRPGRPDINFSKRDNQENEGFMLPNTRLGRSALGAPYELADKEVVYEDNEEKLDFNVNIPFWKSEENLPEKLKHKSESNSVFIIPYPRPGKRFNMIKEKRKSNKVDKEIVDYVLPYPRPGKRLSKELQMIKDSDNDNSLIHSQNVMLQYPRSGKSIDYLFEEEDEVYKNDENQIEGLPEGIFRTQYLNINAAMGSKDYENEGIMDFDDYIQKLDKKSGNELPYARLGRDFSSIVPYPRPGRSISEYKDARYFQSDDENKLNKNESNYETVVYNMYLSGADSDSLRYKRSTAVVPYPRPGRSGTVVPYPRFGKSDAAVLASKQTRSNLVVPYPRPGRSNSVVPYPRLGRSNVQYPRKKRSNPIIQFSRSRRSDSVVPYPRLGRSNSLVPYPRPGKRSVSVVPYPRPGRSEAVVSYTRPGKSEAVVPYPRPGRSEAVVPYPRSGRSGAIVPYPRPGRSGSIVPYPRPGRSGAVVSYPRPGRSEAVVPYPRPGRSGAIVPYPRPGRSGAVVPYPRPGRSNSKRRDSYIVPYPRPGRSGDYEQFRYSFKKEDAGQDMIIPDSVSGRSIKSQDYILPHPRVGKSENRIKHHQSTVGMETVIPYPRLGRSQNKDVNTAHKLNKHMLPRAGDSVYLLPYPRPGRRSE